MTAPLFNVRRIKRSLSCFEKSSLPDPTGRALILPSMVGTEVEELIAAGFDPEKVDCVEHVRSTYEQLAAVYPNVIYNDVTEWLRDCPYLYSYIHLDLCSQLSPEISIGMQRWQGHVTDYSRIRVSICRGRRMGEQYAWEDRLYRETLGRWARLLDIDDAEVTRDDTTAAVVGLVLSNFFFGITDIRTYFDACQRHGDHLPTQWTPTHAIADLSRYCHHEPGSRNYMWTVWMDLCPLPEGNTHDPSWVRAQLQPIYEDLSFFPSIFSLYKDKNTPAPKEKEAVPALLSKKGML